MILFPAAEDLVGHVGIVGHDGVRALGGELGDGLRVVDRPVLHGYVVLVRGIDQPRGAEIDEAVVVAGGNLQLLELVIAVLAVDAEQGVNEEAGHLADAG